MLRSLLLTVIPLLFGCAAVYACTKIIHPFTILDYAILVVTYLGTAIGIQHWLENILKKK